MNAVRSMVILLATILFASCGTHPQDKKVLKSRSTSTAGGSLGQYTLGPPPFSGIGHAQLMGNTRLRVPIRVTDFPESSFFLERGRLRTPGKPIYSQVAVVGRRAGAAGNPGGPVGRRYVEEIDEIDEEGNEFHVDMLVTIDPAAAFLRIEVSILHWNNVDSDDILQSSAVREFRVVHDRNTITLMPL